jgi:hypothetical protein
MEGRDKEGRTIARQEGGLGTEDTNESKEGIKKNRNIHDNIKLNK